MGQQADRRASSAWASRRRTAGRTRCRARRRSASGSPTGSPTACAPGSPSSRACSTTARWLKPVEDLYRWHHGAERYLRNERPLARVGLVYSQQTAWFYGGRAGQAEGRGPRAGLVPGARSRPASPSRWSTTGSSTPTHLAPFRDAHPAEHRRPVRRAVPAAPRVRRAAAAASSRRTRRRSTTSGARSATDFGLADLFGVSFRRPRRGADAERLPAPGGRPPHRPAASAPRGPRGRAADHPRRLPARGQPRGASSPTRR